MDIFEGDTVLLFYDFCGHVPIWVKIFFNKLPFRCMLQFLNKDNSGCTLKVKMTVIHDSAKMNLANLGINWWLLVKTNPKLNYTCTIKHCLLFILFCVNVCLYILAAVLASSILKSSVIGVCNCKHPL